MFPPVLMLLPQRVLAHHVGAPVSLVHTGMQSARGTREAGLEAVVARVRVGHGLREGDLAGVLDGVDPFLCGGRRRGAVGGGGFGIFKGKVLVALEVT